MSLRSSSSDGGGGGGGGDVKSPAQMIKRRLDQL
jgi:hypothetical protein